MKPKRDLMQKAGKAVKKAAPTILTCIGAVGVVATAVLAVKATPKALKRIENAQEAKSAENGKKLTRMETIGACAMCYAPAAITGIATIGCIFGANTLNKRQQAALTTAYAMLSRSYRDYQHSVKNVFGEEGHKKVITDIAQEHVSQEHNITASSFCSMSCLDFPDAVEEERLFYNSLTGKTFTSTISKVLQAEYHLNRNFALRGNVSLNEFLEFLGVATVNGGDEVGWWVDPENEFFWIDFNHYKTPIDDGLDRPEVECYMIETGEPPSPPPKDY